MRKLALLRHAKSSWSDPAEDDYDRPLNARGKSAAPEAGAALHSFGFSPDLILCSSAKRTRETLELAMRFMPVDPSTRITFEDKLYLATPEAMLDRVRKIDDGFKSVLLIGHCPGIHSLAATLSGKGDNAAIERLMVKYPTAALAILSFDLARWRDVGPGAGHLDQFWTPAKS